MAQAAAADWRDLETFSFGDEAALADELCQLVVAGAKTASCWPVCEGQQTEVGKQMVVKDGSDRPRAVIETVELVQRRFSEVDAGFAWREGEGDRTLAWWRKAHERYFDARGAFAPDMMLWCEVFRLVRTIHLDERIQTPTGPDQASKPPTAEQHELIELLSGLLSTESEVEALWLAGSLGKGAGDEYSDVDLLVLAADGAASELSQRVAGRLSEVVAPVLVNRLYGGRVLNVITDDWSRFDLSFVESADLARYDASELTPLLNRSGRRPHTPPKQPYETPPARVVEIATEFLRMLGLAVGALGRQEYQLALTGVDVLRRLTLDLMLEENGVSPAARGGALRRNPFLTDAQRAELASLPPLSADSASIISANLAFARIFLPRAKRLASRVGASWPEAFESATRRRLKARLGIELD